MEKEYIGNLIALAGVNGNTISQENLQILIEKYNLSEVEYQEMIDYCNSYGIYITNGTEYYEIHRHFYQEYCDKYYVEKEISDSDRIRYLSVALTNIVKARIYENPSIYFYLSNSEYRLFRHWIASKLKMTYDHEQLKYMVKNHVKESNKDTTFYMLDSEDPQRCQELSAQIEKTTKEVYDYLINFQKAEEIVDYLLMIISNRRRKKIEEGLGAGKTLCGYTQRRIRNAIKYYLAKTFPTEIIEYICEHLPERNETDTRVHLIDPNNMTVCKVLDDILNRILQ